MNAEALLADLLALGVALLFVYVLALIVAYVVLFPHGVPVA